MCIQKHGRHGQLGCKHYTESVLVGGACATEPRQACPPDGAASSVCGSWVRGSLRSVHRERRQPLGRVPAGTVRPPLLCLRPLVLTGHAAAPRVPGATSRLKGR